MSQITKKQLQYALSQVLIALKDLNARLEKLEGANPPKQDGDVPPVVEGHPPRGD